MPGLILWTALCAVPIYWAISEAVQPIPLGCMEWCNPGWGIAILVTLVVAGVWLTVVALALRRNRRSN